MEESEMQMLQHQVQQIQQVLENIDKQVDELRSIMVSLNDFKNLDGNEEIIFPLANGIFANGKLSDSKTLKINVGNDVVVEKTVDEAIAMMQKQLDEITTYRDELSKQLDSILQKTQD